MLSTVVFFDAFADHLKLSIGLDEASCSSRRSYPSFLFFPGSPTLSTSGLGSVGSPKRTVSLKSAAWYNETDENKDMSPPLQPCVNKFDHFLLGDGNSGNRGSCRFACVRKSGTQYRWNYVTVVNHFAAYLSMPLECSHIFLK